MRSSAGKYQRCVFSFTKLDSPVPDALYASFILCDIICLQIIPNAMI